MSEYMQMLNPREMSTSDEQLEINAIRGVIMMSVIYVLFTAAIVQLTTNLFLDIAWANIVLGGVLIYFVRIHAILTDTRPYLYYILALLAPALAGTLYYFRHGDK
jgi:hypothetical protein